MNTKYTKGPWFAEDTRIFTKQGAHYIAETQIEGMSFTKRGEEAQANARLIAASPELLRTAILVRDLLVSQGASCNAEVLQLEHAIAQALGGDE